MVVADLYPTPLEGPPSSGSSFYSALFTLHQFFEPEEYEEHTAEEDEAMNEVDDFSGAHIAAHKIETYRFNELRYADRDDAVADHLQ